MWTLLFNFLQHWSLLLSIPDVLFPLPYPALPPLNIYPFLYNNLLGTRR